jgi:hypothetical protein
MAVVMTTHFPNPPHNFLSAGTNALVADTSISGKRAFCSGGSYPHSPFITLKQQSVAGLNAQRTANFAGYRNLSLAGDFCLFLQEPPSVPYFITRFLTF